MRPGEAVGGAGVPRALRPATSTQAKTPPAPARTPMRRSPGRGAPGARRRSSRPARARPRPQPLPAQPQGAARPQQMPLRTQARAAAAGSANADTDPAASATAAATRSGPDSTERAGGAAGPDKRHSRPARTERRVHAGDPQGRIRKCRGHATRAAAAAAKSRVAITGEIGLRMIVSICTPSPGPSREGRGSRDFVMPTPRRGGGKDSRQVAISVGAAFQRDDRAESLLPSTSLRYASAYLSVRGRAMKVSA